MSIPLLEQEIIQVIMRGTLSATGAVAKTVNQIYHFRRTTWATPWVKSEVDTAFQAAIGDIVLAALNLSYTQTANLIRCVNDAQDPDESFVQAGVGAITGDRLPSHATVILNLKSATRGAWAQGRKFYAGISESDTVMDLLAGGAITRWNAVGAAILAGFTDASGNVYVPAVLSYSFSDLTENPTDVLATDINRVILNKTVGRFKKRKQATIN